jgi:hypothetical protein
MFLDLVFRKYNLTFHFSDTGKNHKCAKFPICAREGKVEKRKFATLS